jgi:hypothetical protein
MSNGPGGPGGGQPDEEGVLSPLGGERRLGHVAGIDARLAGIAVEQQGDRREQGRRVAAGEIGPADRPAEQHVAAEQGLVGRDGVGHVAGTVAGGEDDVELEAGELEPLAAGDGVLGLVALERAEAGPGDVAVDVGEDVALELGHPDLGAGGGGERSDGADVVEVGVGEEDGRHGEAVGVQRGEQPIGLLAGVDHEGPGRAGGPGDIAVLLDGADRVAADLERHLAAFWRWRRL